MKKVLASVGLAALLLGACTDAEEAVEVEAEEHQKVAEVDDEIKEYAELMLELNGTGEQSYYQTIDDANQYGLLYDSDVLDSLRETESKVATAIDELETELEYSEGDRWYLTMGAYRLTTRTHVLLLKVITNNNTDQLYVDRILQEHKRDIEPFEEELQQLLSK